jgi:formate dehydrogenase assembly factor FdhD
MSGAAGRGSLGPAGAARPVDVVTYEAGGAERRQDLLAAEEPLELRVVVEEVGRQVQKTLAAGIPVLAAVGAPSSLAVDLAREFGLTVVGFLLDRRFNVSAGEERIA